MSFFADLRLGFRNLLNNPGFTAVAVAMLALGIGVNATVFTVTNAVLFKGFPQIDRNDRLLYISNGGCCISYPDFEDIRAQSKSFDGMAIVHGIARVVSDQTGFPDRIEITEVSAATFEVTGRKPILGRDFAASDEVLGAAPVAMLNYGFWQRRYAKNPAIVGQTIRMNGAPTTIIGIMPEGYSFPQTVDAWVPLVKTETVRTRESTQTWFAFGHLSDGVTFESARAEVEGIIKRLETEYPLTDMRRHLVVQRFHEFFIGPNATLIYGTMWGAVGFVLLIACANLANLLLARAMGRSREISVRIALGAGRWRIIRQLLVESLMLSSVGGFFGWWLAQWGVRAYSLAMAHKSSWLIVDYTMDQRVLAYLIAISVGTGILFGLAPALRLSGLDVNSSLKDGSRGATSGRGKHLSASLVTAEMALAVVLLAGAGVLIRSFLKIHNANIGVNMSNVLVGLVQPLPGKYPTAGEKVSFFDSLTARLGALPGVDSVTTSEVLPTAGSPRFPYEMAGSPPSEYGNRPVLRALRVGPGYFRLFGASLLSGREPDDSDTPSGLPVAVVNQMFASQHWPGEDPLGHRLRLFTDKTPGPWLTVVGIAPNIVQNDGDRQRLDPMIYLPYRQQPVSAMWVLVHTRTPPASLASAFHREVQALDADVPLYGPFTLVERLEQFWDSRFYGTLFLIFAAIALLLASIGLYTVVAHAVSRRTQEIGVRMAIGATTRDILTLVLLQGMAPLGIGLAIGLAASAAVNRLLVASLVQISPSDPLTLLAASTTLIVSAALGCLIPAIRAMQVDPLEALRHE